MKRLTGSDENCTLACFVKKTEETTLLWFKNEEIVNQSNSGISLLVKVLEQDFGSSYRCVVSNPADEQSLVVDGKIFCSEQNSTDSRKFQCEFSRFKGYCHWPMLFGVFCWCWLFCLTDIPAVVILSLLIVIVTSVALIKWKCFNNKRTTNHTEGMYLFVYSLCCTTDFVQFKCQHMLINC